MTPFEAQKGPFGPLFGALLQGRTGLSDQGTGRGPGTPKKGSKKGPFGPVLGPPNNRAALGRGPPKRGPKGVKRASKSSTGHAWA